MKELIKYYNQAVSKIPFLKYTRIILVTALVLAIIAYLKLKNVDVFFYAFVVLFLTFLTFLLAQLTNSKEKTIRIAFYIVVYCVVITICTALLSFATFIIIEKPVFYQRWFPQENLSKDTTAKTKDLNNSTKVILNDSLHSAKSPSKSLPIGNSNEDEIHNKKAEISIQLSEKSNGFSKIFINGEEAFALPNSTKLNPRIEIENNSITKKILIITSDGDSCFTILPASFDKNFFRLVPNCN